MKGDAAAALTELRAQYDIGADPAVVLNDLAEFTHFVTRVKVVPAVADDVSLSEAERTARPRLRRQAFHARAVAHLADAAQGHRRGAGLRPPGRRRRDGAGAHRLCRRPADAGRSRSARWARAAARSARAAREGMPMAAARRRRAPRRASRRATTRRAAPRAPRRPCRRSRRPMPVAQPTAPTLALNTFADVVALAAEKRDIAMKLALERDVRLVRCEDGQLEIALEPNAAKGLVHDLQRKLDAVDRQALDRGGVERAGRADLARAGRGARSRARSAACRPIRWCRRC